MQLFMFIVTPSPTNHSLIGASTPVLYDNKSQRPGSRKRTDIYSSVNQRRFHTTAHLWNVHLQRSFNWRHQQFRSRLWYATHRRWQTKSRRDFWQFAFCLCLLLESWDNSTEFYFSIRVVFSVRFIRPERRGLLSLSRGDEREAHWYWNSTERFKASYGW